MTPLLYQINTRCWLRDLAARERRAVTLADVPESEFLAWQNHGFTHLWLMGVWTTGARSRAQALGAADLLQAFRTALPDFTEQDVGGSPYAIADYQVPAALGSENGLKQFRARLAKWGLRLVLDFVPNHVGLDHSWVSARPQLFVQGSGKAPETFLEQTAQGPRWLAHGKDPYFAGWTDTVQLDYRLTDTRRAMLELLDSVAARCDAVRCDMAMLLLNDVFARTWQGFPAVASREPDPAPEFWEVAIKEVKQRWPGFQFMAEVYWGLEPRLQALGFDFTYDKTLYDRLVEKDAVGVQQHLLGLPAPVAEAGAHFLENHDEPRIASLLSMEEHRAAALLILTLPGLRFLHEGQLSGAKLKLPVQLIRRTVETEQADIRLLYEQILAVLPKTAVGMGQARLLKPQPAWEGNSTSQNYILVQWQSDASEFDLAVINLAPHRAQCRAHLEIDNLPAHTWEMRDLVGQERYERTGQTLQSEGLFLDLAGHGAQLFHFKPLK